MRTTKLLLLLFSIFFVFSCDKKNSDDENFNSEVSLFKEYISSFSDGLISTHSDIRVVLVSENKNWETNEELDQDLFQINPTVKGKVRALSSNTVAFVPDSKLDPDTEYQISFNLKMFHKAVKKELSVFNFTVKTIKQDFIVTTNELQSYDKEYQYLTCKISTADFLDFETAKKLITSKQLMDGKQLKIKFEKTTSIAKEFKFIVDSIKRQEEDSKIEIRYDGSDFDIDQKGKIDYLITGKNNFKVINVTISDTDENALKINFSDELQQSQDFTGLVSIANTTNLKFSVDGNILKVFYNFSEYNDNSEMQYGDVKVEIFEGITSQYGYKLKANFSTVISFDQIKPNIRFLKNGTILPSSNNLKINFESVNLSAVDVKVYKIFENNILQFLQFNDLNGKQKLTKVALPVAKKTINLKEKSFVNFSKWNTYALDLSKILKPEPGAIYRVELSFNKKYSLYKCNGANNEEENDKEEEEDETQKNYSQNGNDYDYDYEYDYEDYNWQDREDPCTNSYYYNTTIGTNVLSSDLGVIAKRSLNKSFFIAVNNLITTSPVSGATVKLYNYQQQLLAEKNTDNNGFANFDLKQYAYFAIVTKDRQSTYLKLDDGNSLSISNFDVSGVVLSKGLKGYIYGERGVWRPGDDLYLSFILNDAANKIPVAHPIKFKLSDPQGKVVFQTMQKVNNYNHYSFKVPTNSDDKTGNWEAKVSVGGATFYKSIKVETIKPNRLKIKNTFSNKILSAFTSNKMDVQVNWLHGAVAKNLKLEMQARFSQKGTSFKGYSDYDFDDDVRKFNTEEINVFSGKVDALGKASLSLNPKLENKAPGMLTAAIITKVYEEGGDFSTDVTSADYSPYKTYLGLKLPDLNRYNMLETRKANQFKVVALHENGAPKKLNGLQVKVYKVKWRWWWDASDDDISIYRESNYMTPFKSYILNTDSNGKGSFSFSLSDEEWGRYLISVTDPLGGHSTSQTVNIDWPLWSGKTRNTEASTANMLVFSTNKKKYEVGEKAVVSFPSSEGGRALISIENGAGVLKTLWVPTKKIETRFYLPIERNMAPNIFINISLLQPHAFTKNDSPIRMYGIMPIEVIDKNTILKPKIIMPKVLRPEQSYNMLVSESSGKPMTYTIAVVDDGLLDLTRFKTPNAWDSFYQRESLGVRTWDIYNDVLGAYGGKVNQIFSIGGDEDTGGSKNKKANRFKPVVIYLGPYELKAKETKRHTLKLPKYIGSVRTMVVAGNAKTSAYGASEETTPVRSPLMVLASLPRKISPSEKVTLPVTVFAMEKHIKNVSVQVKTTKGLKITGNAKQNIIFNSPDEKMLYFQLEVGENTGKAKVEIIATSGSEKSSYEVEMDRTNPNPVTATFTDVILKPNSTQTLSWNTFGTKGSNQARLEVSSMPIINFNGRLQYLVQYPHGCVEQTTSSVFPQLYLSDIADISTERNLEIQKNIKAGINRLYDFQLSDGGLGYWQGERTADDWGTSYAGHFMIEAEKKGYVLPIGFKQKWIYYQQNQAKKWRLESDYSNDIAQAYRLYTLALAGVADLSSMNRLRESIKLSNEGKLRLAAAYALAGQKQVGINLLLKSVIEEPTTKSYYYYYGSAERNRAMTLETLILLDQKKKAFLTATKLAKLLASENWMSTQTTSYCLFAMAKFAKANGGGGIVLQLNEGGKIKNLSTNKSIVERQLAVKSGSNSIVIKNKKNNVLYVRVLNSGILPVGQEKEERKNIAVSLVFKDRKGQIINVSNINQGTEFMAEVTVKNLKAETINNLALSQILPSGFEIVNTRFTDFGDTSQNEADYIDIRDDRTNFYFSLSASQSKTFRILLNASYLGSYYLPGVQCEAMYDNTYLARTSGKWIEIVK